MSQLNPHSEALSRRQRWWGPRRVWVGVGLVLVGVGLAVSALWPAAPTLAQANCQAADLGARYHLSGRAAVLTAPLLEAGGPGVATHTVELVDAQLTYTVLECSLIRYADATAAQRALERVCAGRVAAPAIGEAACTWAGPAPRNLAFRRGAHLVLMSGDVADLPAAQVDQRLR